MGVSSLSSQYKIRPADLLQETDLDDLQRLNRLTFPDDKVLEFEDYWWIAEHRGEPVAFTGLRASLTLPNAGYMTRSGVLENHRQQGLQRRFITLRERKARSLGWRALLVDTTDNVQSANNLIKRGFRMYEPTIDYGFPTTLYWRKDLRCEPS